MGDLRDRAIEAAAKAAWLQAQKTDPNVLPWEEVQPKARQARLDLYRAAIEAYEAVIAEANDGQTHAEGCWAWGRRHYGCAVGRIERLEAENVRMSKIEDAGRSMNLRICGGELSCSEKDLMRFDAVLSDNPRPDAADE